MKICLYFIVFYLHSLEKEDDCFIYNPEAQSWNPMGTMRNKRYNAELVKIAEDTQWIFGKY